MSRMIKLVIVGAGDHGRGVLEIAKACNAEARQYDIVGFVDEDSRKHGKRIDAVPVLGDLNWIRENCASRCALIFGIASSSAKKALVRKLHGWPIEFVNLIHPTAVLGSEVRLGTGNIIAAGVVMAYNTVVGNHITVNLNATIGHDCSIGSYTTIAPGANIAGQVEVGEGCDIGLNATVIRGLHIGQWSTLGPGSVLLKDIGPQSHCFGNPARPYVAVSRPTAPRADEPGLGVAATG